MRLLTRLKSTDCPARRPVACRPWLEALEDRFAPAVFSIGNAQITESDTGSVFATFTVNATGVVSPAGASVGWSTRPGTATPGADYVPSSERVFIPFGETSRQIRVEVLGDHLNEDSETFFIDLSNPSFGDTIADPLGVGTIWDNDPLPRVSISNAPNVTEGHSGDVDAVFTVSLSAVSGRTVTVGYRTWDGTATAGQDFRSRIGTLTFHPGQLTQMVVVPVIGDRISETTEDFYVHLEIPRNAVIGVHRGQLTIIDDEPVPSVSINDVQMSEGDTGWTHFTFTCTFREVSKL